MDARPALSPWVNATPLVFAHRGSSAARPEHTVAAYELAVDEGVDGFECDVRLTRDGHLVCIHDASITRTSNGRGRVTRLTLAELNRHDYSSWHRPSVPNRGPDAVVSVDDGILTLDRLLTLARDAGRPLRLLVETKHPSRYGGDVERRLVDLLRHHGLTAGGPASAPGVAVTVMSFSVRALRRFRALAPEIPTVFLFDIPTPSIWSGRPPDGVDLLGPSIRVVRHWPELVRRAHDRGVGVLVWTVNEPADIDLVRTLGVDGIISDRPADVLAALNRPPVSDGGRIEPATPPQTDSLVPGDGRLGPCPSTTGVPTSGV